MNNIILGIDISKLTFDVALLNDDKVKTKKFTNTSKGFSELKQWLKNNEIDSVHACMEATGGYESKLAQYLYDNNFKVSVINPARIKGFSMSKLSRVKTDKADSELIAQFCQAMQPDLWKPTPLNIQELQQWVRRLDSLIANKNQENNRLDGASEVVAINISTHIEFLDKQIQEVEELISNNIKGHQDLNDKSKLLNSIPGIGEKTIAIILAFLTVENFDSAKQVVAFVGLNPKPKQSGSSVLGAGRISKTGDADLRKAFYMPAIVSLRFNPIIKGFAERLSSVGKAKMIVVIAAMRKLLHIIYGVLKNKTPFNKNVKTI
ncbi:MAG: IS110 family transposase [Rickettsiaceae bacterium]|jgi:transposase|nr:IS110 family transposase [Rickettsiales bacterium]MBP9778110.1 IS110 family transposase [Rickettsiaceae bacterium]NDE19805.1 IS110 family transposase [Alphaproteobacteria bacterium]